MNFVGLLQSIEGAIYEIVAWAMLLPKTLFRTITRPSWGPGYVNAEWQKEEEEGRFDEYLPPGLLWLIVSVLQILFNDPIAAWGEFFADVPLLARLFGTFQALEGDSRLAVQVLILLSYPLAYMVWTERLNETPIRKSTLKRTFQIHCYALAPAQFLGILGLVIPGLSVLFVWFYETFVFRRELGMGRLKAIFHALMPQLLLGVLILASVFVAFMIEA